MTAPTDIGPGAGAGDDDLLAAEYVLGTLPADERETAEARIAVEPEMAAAAARWEARFSPLNAAYTPSPAPELMPAIEVRLFGTPVRVQRRNLFRLGLALAGAAVAAIALTAVILGETDAVRPPPDRFAATIEAEGVPLVFAVAWSADRKELVVNRTVGLDPPVGRDYELWLIGIGDAPVPLGIIRGNETRLSLPSLHEGLMLGVSLERQGGADDGAAAGEMLVTGEITKL